MQASTICSKCHKKGSCCEEFHLLAIHQWFDTKEESEKHLEVSVPKLKELVPMFEYKRQAQGNCCGWTAMFGCTKVLPDGVMWNL